MPGLTPEEQQKLRLIAADEIERWKEAYENLRDYAESKGFDTVFRP